MKTVSFFALLSLVRAYRLDEKSTALLTDEQIVDNRLPFPKGLDFTKLYCHDSLPASAPVPTAHATFTTSSVLPTSLTKCTLDSDCTISTHPFCVESFCRECRSSSDCTDPSALFCNHDTQYTCSSCQSDSDCGSAEQSKICRAVESRKKCVPCSSNSVPENAILSSDSHCASWRCPENQMKTPDGSSCTTCPICQDGQFLIPGEFFALSTPTFFYPKCDPISIDAKCIDCPSTVCASSLTPSFDHRDDPNVGYLPSTYPCNAFKCNPGWYLDKTVNQCRLCQLQSCEAGKFLSGCGGSSSGTCIDCPPQMVSIGTPFVDPKSLTFPISNPKEVCRPKCSDGFTSHGLHRLLHGNVQIVTQQFVRQGLSLVVVVLMRTRDSVYLVPQLRLLDGSGHPMITAAGSPNALPALQVVHWLTAEVLMLVYALPVRSLSPLKPIHGLSSLITSP